MYNHGVSFVNGCTAYRSYVHTTKDEVVRRFTVNTDGWELRISKRNERLVVRNKDTVLECFRLETYAAPSVHVHRADQYKEHNTVGIHRDRFSVSRYGVVLLPMTDISKVLEKYPAEFDDPFTCLEGGKMELKWVK
jgi:hypothetical protein